MFVDLEKYSYIRSFSVPSLSVIFLTSSEDEEDALRGGKTGRMEKM